MSGGGSVARGGRTGGRLTSRGRGQSAAARGRLRSTISNASNSSLRRLGPQLGYPRGLSGNAVRGRLLAAESRGRLSNAEIRRIRQL